MNSFSVRDITRITLHMRDMSKNEASLYVEGFVTLAHLMCMADDIRILEVEPITNSVACVTSLFDACKVLDVPITARSREMSKEIYDWHEIVKNQLKGMIRK